MKKDDFKQKAHEVLDELIEYIDKLEQKANDIADDAKDEYYQQLENLRGIRDKLSAKLEDYEKRIEPKRDIIRNIEIIKDSICNFFEDVAESWKENYNNVTEELKNN